MPRTILLIDDDETLLDLLSEHLREAGFMPSSAPTGQDGLQLNEQLSPDLIVLDVMMPGMDGWETCRRLRAGSQVPIIMLTAKGEEFDKLRGFRLGVDDYMTKPFSFAELSARIGAVLTRSLRAPPVSATFHSGDLTVEFDRRRVFRAGVLVELTPTEYGLLEALIRHAGRPVPTEQLLREVWGPEYAGETDHVKHYIWALRKKIEADPGAPEHIRTERGFGYQFD